TNNTCFLTREDYEAHEARVCIHAGEILADPRRVKKYTDQQYLRSPAEMQTLFADIPEALENTVEIARRCTVKLSLGKSILPACQVPENYDSETWLAKSAATGLAARLARRPPAD